MKRYLAYIRVSTVKQGERGSSLAEQKSAIENYAERNGLAVSGWFEEIETAASQGRRKFAMVLSALRTGKAEGLIVHKIDRSARNLRDWADLGDLIDRGVDVRFVSDNFDLLSRGGRLSADIQAVVAADYIRNLREEVKKGMYGRLKQGLYPWAAPLGYLNNGKAKLKTIDPEKGPLIQHLFERYATNTVGFEALRHELANMGLRSRTGIPLALDTLTRVLNNPFYVGIIRIGSTGETFAGAHEPLVTQAQFQRVQAVLRGRTAPRVKKNQFPFRRLIKCSGCHRLSLIGEVQKGIVYYRCHGRACKGIIWRQDAIDRFVADQIGRVALTTGGRGDNGDEIRDLRLLVDKECKAETDSRQKLTASLKLRLAHIEERLARLTDLVVDETIDRISYNTRKESLFLERRGIEESLARTVWRSPLLELFEKLERDNSKLLGYQSVSDDQKRELVEIVSSNFIASAENLVLTLHSPYLESAEPENPMRCAHHRGDVRTFRVFQALKKLAAAEEGCAIDQSLVPMSPTSPPHSALDMGWLP